MWRVSTDKKGLERVGVLGRSEPGAGQREEGSLPQGEEADLKEQAVRGIINDIGVFERGERGRDGLCVVVAVGTEHRLGRWKNIKGKNGAVVFEVPTIQRLENGTGGKGVENVDDGEIK